MTNIFITAATMKKMQAKAEADHMIYVDRFCLPDDQVAMIFFPKPNEDVAVVLFESGGGSYRGELVHGIKKYGFVVNQPEGVQFVGHNIQDAMYGFVYLATIAASLFANTKQAEYGTAMNRRAKRLALSCGVKGNTYRILDLSAPVLHHIPEAHETCPSGIKQRYHMRRGHYRTLRSGKQVFVRACYAGDKAIGIVHKDYAL